MILAKMEITVACTATTVIEPGIALKACLNSAPDIAFHNPLSNEIVMLAQRNESTRAVIALANCTRKMISVFKPDVRAPNCNSFLKAAGAL